MTSPDNITIDRQVADMALDYLYDLSGEWRWRDSLSGPRNKLAFEELQATIKKLEHATGRKPNGV